MTGATTVSAGKADFDEIYDAPDPRAYARTLSALDYQIPEHARPVFSRLAGVLAERGAGPVSVVDLCCSYGINAALLRCELTLDDLFEHYGGSDVAALSGEELAAADRRYFAAQRHGDDTRVIGLDASKNAVDYAVGVGLLDAGATEDLEHDEPSPGLRTLLSGADLVTVTGGIGYITETTVDHVVAAATTETPPWVAAFTLRWVDMGPVSSVLADHGLVVETVPDHTFRQRRFIDDAERDYVFGELARRGLDPADAEVDGFHHAELIVARPAADRDAVPLADLLAAPLEA